jgi:uncharacterized OsmC-like protein
MDLRSVQKPLKDAYRSDPAASRITLVASASETETPIACSVDLGRTNYDAQAHPGVGGAGTAACSGDLLLGALAACAQLTCQMVAAAMEVPIADIRVIVEGDLDLAGTLGVSREAPVGFESIRLRFDIDAPCATEEQRAVPLSLAEPQRRTACPDIWSSGSSRLVRSRCPMSGGSRAASSSSSSPRSRGSTATWPLTSREA